MGAVKQNIAAYGEHFDSPPNAFSFEIEAVHKQTIKPMVTKFLSIYTALLIVLSFSWTREWGYALVLAVLTAVFNIYMDDRERRKIGVS